MGCVHSLATPQPRAHAWRAGQSHATGSTADEACPGAGQWKQPAAQSTAATSTTASRRTICVNRSEGSDARDTVSIGAGCRAPYHAQPQTHLLACRDPKGGQRLQSCHRRDRSSRSRRQPRSREPLVGSLREPLLDSLRLRSVVHRRQPPRVAFGRQLSSSSFGHRGEGTKAHLKLQDVHPGRIPPCPTYRICAGESTRPNSGVLHNSHPTILQVTHTAHDCTEVSIPSGHTS